MYNQVWFTQRADVGDVPFNFASQAEKAKNKVKGGLPLATIGFNTSDLQKEVRRDLLDGPKMRRNIHTPICTRSLHNKICTSPALMWDDVFVLIGRRTFRVCRYCSALAKRRPRRSPPRPPTRRVTLPRRCDARRRLPDDDHSAALCFYFVPLRPSDSVVLQRCWRYEEILHIQCLHTSDDGHGSDTALASSQSGPRLM